MMKNTFFILIALLIPTFTFAQSDFEGINYQAVLRADDGSVLSDTKIDLLIELTNISSENIYYSELHKLTTNKYGLITAVIGKGEKIDGYMRNVPWEQKDIYIRLYRMDINDEKLLISENKLLTVPYAYHAGSADKLIYDDSRGGDEEANNFNYWRLGGNNIGEGPTVFKYLGTNNATNLDFYTNGEKRGSFSGTSFDFELRTNLLVEHDFTLLGDSKIFGDELILGNSIIEQNVDIGKDLYTKGNFNLIGLGVFENETESTSPDNGAVTVFGGVGIGKQLNVGGITRIWNNTQSFMPDNGALIVDGGVGIGLQLNVGGITQIWDNSQSTAIDNGSFITNGGAGIGLQLNVGGIGHFYDDTQSTMTDNGALILAGGMGIAKQANIGGVTRIWDETESTKITNGALIVDGGVGIHSNTNIGGALDVEFTTTLNDLTVVTDETQSTMPKNGSFVTLGGAGIGRNLNVGGEFKLDGDLTVDGIAYFNNMAESNDPFSGGVIIKGGLGVQKRLNVAGRVEIDGSTTAKSNVIIEDVTEATSTTTGALVVAGGTGIDGDLHVGGEVIVGDRIEANNGIAITGGPSNESSFEGYPLQVSGSNQGISIKVNGSRNNSNNFISFWDESSSSELGRIEGETIPELGTTNNDYMVQRDLYIAETVFATIQVGSAIAALVEEATDLAAAYASVNACFGTGAVGCPPIASLVAAAPLNVAISTVDLAAQVGQFITLEIEFGKFVELAESQVGVSYQSGAGDYAEWLLKSNQLEKFEPGDIVGVKGGAISKDLLGAEQYLVVSHRPMILGNVQEESRKHMYEKIAFLGQVPVKVIGNVSKGDYILPAGSGLGYGIAVSPDKMTADDYQKIVGVAWADSNAEKPGYVMTAVGLNAGDVSKEVAKQQKMINKQQSEIEMMKNDLAQMKAMIADIANGNEIQPLDIMVVDQDQESIDIESEIRKQDLENILYSIKSYQNWLTVDKLKEGMEGYRNNLIRDKVDIKSHKFFNKYDNDSKFRDSILADVVERVNTMSAAQLAKFEHNLRVELDMISK